MHALAVCRMYKQGPYDVGEPQQRRLGGASRLGSCMLRVSLCDSALV